jgi:Fic family protein
VEVSNYVSALQFGLKRVKQDFPISIRLIKEMHGVLLAKGRGQTKDPGEFRASQNWIGGSRPGNAVYVPPPRDEVVSLMGQIETFYHEQQSLPALVKAALIHVQFETIRPFLDGNGKLGRVADILLHGCPRDGATGGHNMARCPATPSTRSSPDRETRTNSRVNDSCAWASSKKPYLTISTASKDLRLSQPAVTNAMRALQKLEIVRENSGRNWNKILVYSKYLRIMTEGAELSAE